jgi:hypothetical protein
MGVITRGEREIDLAFETFPTKAHELLAERITGIIDTLQARIEEAAPEKTGLLRSEIHERLYADLPQRVAGYVQVIAARDPEHEYAKAASLEYGVNKPRRVAERANRFETLTGRLERPHRLLAARLGSAVHMRAFRYLRGPIEQMRPEIEGELAEALNAAAGEG